MSNSSLEPISNVTTSASLLSVNELLAQLGFETWQTVINTFVLPPINLIGIVFCSFSLGIFFRSSFSDPIFFYYKLVSFAFFLTCFLINLPLFFVSKSAAFGSYFYRDSSGRTQTATFYFLTPSDFSLTYFGQILNGFATFFLNLFLTFLVGVILNVSSFIKYRSHVNNRKREVEQLQLSSINNRPTTNREMIQMSLRENMERKIEKNMFFMALTLSTISFISRFLLMMCYLYYFIFSSFSNSLLILLIANCIYTFGPTISIFIFYSFNQMFRDETNKKVFLRTT